MTHHIPHYAGIDVSKDHLDAHVIPAVQARRFANTKSGWRALAKWLAAFAPERIVYESTGPYHQGMERALASRTLPIVRVNAQRARSFANAIGTIAKTDPVDARMLAQYGAAVDLPVTELNSEAIEEMRGFEAARRALVKTRTALANRSKNLMSALLKRQAKNTRKQIDAHIAEIDEAVQALIAKHHDLAQRYQILCSIPGIGQATAVSLIVLMPELGTLDERQAASLAGLAPIARDSGKWKGKRFCQGGRAKLRQALYMPALVALRFNADMKAKYEALIERGKPAKVAITAIMRKLVILANALLRDNRNWRPIAS
jgi:transposase